MAHMNSGWAEPRFCDEIYHVGHEGLEFEGSVFHGVYFTCCCGRSESNETCGLL